MRCVYHRVPENMVGSVLYPMNQLQTVSPKLHKLYRAGYGGREQLLERKIPYLDCLWNDVLHCSPVHPQKVVEALKKAGVKDIPHQEYFEINVDSDIDISNAVIFYRNSNQPGDISFEKAGEADWANVAVIPPITLAHFEDVATKTEPLFAYHDIPHFLYLGTIETKNLKRIKV